MKPTTPGYYITSHNPDGGCRTLVKVIKKGRGLQVQPMFPYYSPDKMSSIGEDELRWEPIDEKDAKIIMTIRKIN
jgi:hypothetical protein